MYSSFREEAVNGKCLVCEDPAVTGFQPSGDGLEFICRRCGAYRVSGEFVWEMPQPDSPLYEFRYRMSWAFRSASERVKDIRDLPFHLGSEALPLLNASDPTVDEKLGNLLAFLARKSKGPGRYADFDCANDHTIACARDGDEALFLLESLREDSLIVLTEETLDAKEYGYRLTAAGWSELTRRENSGAESNNVFIAMSFAPDRAAAADAIGSAVAATLYKPIRMDKVEHLNRIDDEILSRLRSSKFLIVDLSRQNPGAYFEAGFMLGLGRPVIWVCSKEDLDKVHFDARQYNIIDYDDAGELQRRLRYRIEAVIGKGTQMSV